MQDWPAGALALDIDLVDTEHPLSVGGSALSRLPAERTALLVQVSAAAEAGTNATAESRPTASQMAAACDVLQQLLPSVRLSACIASSSNMSLSGFAQGATFAADVVARDGSISTAAFEPEAVSTYLPYSTPARDSFQVSHGVTWGAGFAPLRPGQRRAVTAVISDLPNCGPAGLFFQPSASGSGPVAAFMAQRAAELLPTVGGQWRSHSLHVTIAPAREAGSVTVAVAEVATGSKLQSDNSACIRSNITTGSGSASAFKGAFYAALDRVCRQHIDATEPGTAAPVSLVDSWLRAGNTPAVRWSARVCRELNNTGLHRELEYQVSATAEFDVSALPAGAAGEAQSAFAPSAASSCHLLLVQRLERSTYFDLDEVRERQRGDPLDVSGMTADAAALAKQLAAGPRLRAFSKFIDVERPTSASTEHVVLLAVPVQDKQRAQLGSRFGGATVSIQQVGGAGSRYRAVVEATLRELVHARYQSPGCAEGNATTTSTTTTGGSVAARAPAASSAAGCRTWRDALNHFGQLHDDGTIYISADAPQQLFGAAATAAHAQQQAVLRTRPYTSGCYAMAHLPMPTVHLQCVPRVAAAQAVNSDPLAMLGAALASSGAPVGSWMPAEMLTAAVPGVPGYDATCTPPLAPVPVGDVVHARTVGLLTAAAAMTGAAMLCLLAGIRRSASKQKAS